MKIKQKGYGRIEIDNSEKDIVGIWNMGSREGKDNNEVNVVHVERESIDKLIQILTECKDVTKRNA